MVSRMLTGSAQSGLVSTKAHINALTIKDQTNNALVIELQQ